MAKFSTLLFVLMSSGTFHVPPEVGDGHDYDNIALNLARDRGFGHYWSDPEWRKPYEEFRNKDLYNSLLTRSGNYHPTSYRPPMIPLLLSITYRILGRNFAVWRVLNCLFIALALTVAISVSLQLSGAVTSLVVLILGLLDSESYFYGYSFGTEGLSILLVSALIILVCRLMKARSQSDLLLLGMLFTLMILTRTSFVLWAISLCFFLLPYIGFRKVIVVAVTTVILYSPWALRNISLTEGYYPLGLQGSLNAAYAWSDSAMHLRGVWMATNLPEVISCHSTIDSISEVSLAECLVKSSKQWFTHHLYDIPILVLYKLRSFWWTDTITYQKILVILSFFGFISLTWIPLKASSLFICMSASLSIAITWNVVNGRFLFQLHPLFYILASIGIANCSLKLNKLLRRA